MYAFRPSRRSFLVASCAGLAGLAGPAPGAIAATTGGRAKSTVLFFLSGGASHVDTWDMKPEAPAEYRGLFKPIATSAPGIRLCEHLPMLAKQAHHLAVVNSVGGSVNTNDHHAGYYYNLTGHPADPSFLTLGNDRTPQPDDWPFVGAVAGMKRPQVGSLPNAITLPQKPSKLPYTRPGQFAARLGVEHDPLYVIGDRARPMEFHAPALSLEGGATADRLLDRRALLRALDDARRDLDRAARVQTWTSVRDRAWGLLSAKGTADAFDLKKEPEGVRHRYGTGTNAMSLLLARRLVEAGVPFITVFWLEDEKIDAKCKSGGGWDTHGSNFSCLKDSLLPEFDRAFSALIEDLSARGLLDSTLLWVTSEMGRKPKIGDPRSGGPGGAGRDHWTHCLSVLFAGGGVRGGQVYGSSDRRGEYPAEHPVTPTHVARTVYHAMGIDDLQFTDRQGRTIGLLPDAEPLSALF